MSLNTTVLPWYVWLKIMKYVYFFWMKWSNILYLISVSTFSHHHFSNIIRVFWEFNNLDIPWDLRYSYIAWHHYWGETITGKMNSSFQNLLISFVISKHWTTSGHLQFHSWRKWKWIFKSVHGWGNTFCWRMFDAQSALLSPAPCQV